MPSECRVSDRADPKTDLPHHRRARVVDGADCVRAALENLPERLDPDRSSVTISSGRTRVDPEELELAIVASLNYLRDAIPGGKIALDAATVADGYQVAMEARPLPGATIAVEAGPPPRSLVVARRVAVAASGRFALERSPELVRVTLAVPDAAEAPTATRVLIIDDEVAGRATLAALLELDGHEVSECSSLGQASAALRSGAEFDAILIDRQLPDGRGDTLAASVQSALPNASLILMTGEAVDAVPVGFHGAYQKGMDPTILTELVGRLLQAARDN
jgi:CheY-like chemotaxis protein